MTAMAWDQPLTRVLKLKSGDELHTLQDAAEAFLRRFGNVCHDAPIAYGIELMMTAAQTGEEADRKAATEQVARVLKDQRMV